MSKLFDRIKQIVREATLNPSMAGQRAPAVVPQHAGPRQAGSPNTGRPRPTRTTPPRAQYAPVIKPKPTPSINDRGRVGNDYAGVKKSGLASGSEIASAIDRRPAPPPTPAQKQNTPFRAKVAPNRPGFNSAAERPKTNTPVNVAPARPVQANITGKSNLQGGGEPSLVSKSDNLNASKPNNSMASRGNIATNNAGRRITPVKPAEATAAKVDKAKQATGARANKPQAGTRQNRGATVSNKAPKAPKIQAPRVKTNFKGGFGQVGVSRFDTKRTNK